MEISELVRSLLLKRGYESPENIATFLNPDYDLHTHSPFLVEGMERALERLFAAISANERIAVYADFDCDGIPGAAILSDFFKKIGYENFEVYLPHRDREGYGFHKEAIEQLSARGVSLIITVDVGTVAFEGVAFAKEKGVDVIVTDHHEVQGGVPDCVAVLNPKMGAYPFPHLCGAAMAYKLAHAALIEGKRRALPAFLAIPDGWEKWLLDLVAIATVADLVPLIGENRVLAHFGLKVLRKTQRAGLVALLSKLRLRRENISEDDIGFSIAPRINAASRMDVPDLALKLLTTNDPLEAEHIAAQLEELNARRKGAVAVIVKQAKKHVKERYAPEEKMVVLGNPEWKPALLGLAANSIMGERGGTVCVWGRDALGRLKGSCRSDGVSVVALFGAAKESLIEYGGHEKSGGFSVSAEHVHHLPEILARAYATLAAPAVVEERSIDATLALGEVAWPLFDELSQLAPFGIGNPKPLFRVSDVLVTEVKSFGKEKNHIELQLECRRTGARARAYDFFRTSAGFTVAPSPGLTVGVHASLERDTYRGALALRLNDVVSL